VEWDAGALMKASAAHADVAVFSFHAVKNFPTADAGMVCFQDTTLDEQARAWSWLGMDKDTYSRTVSSTPGYT
jgi:dTDP-4-amino-4,6-dideoxygalactose transaminase